MYLLVLCTVCTVLDVCCLYINEKKIILFISSILIQNLRNEMLINLSVQGIVRALEEHQLPLLQGNVSIYVRRAGPNYQEGLKIMRELGM